MKAAFAAACAALVGVTMIPALLANGDPAPLATCGVGGEGVEAILTTIRTLESGGNYAAQAAGSTASGAYQFVDSTWGDYGGYPRAADAPPEVQDAKAAELVVAILDEHGGDVTVVPVVWYIGHLPAVGSAEWNTTPHPEAGNTLTPREYQQRWLTMHDELQRAAPDGGGTTPARAQGAGACLSGSIGAIDGEWSLPGPRELIDANPAALTTPHHDYPAWDWIIPANTPIYAVRGGTVTSVRYWPHNWWSEGCGTDSTGCETCGVGVTITDAENTRWTYCHGTDLTVTLGADVPAGQQVMWSGNTGRSATAHLHLEIRTADGQRRCPQPLISALAARQPPYTSATSGTCSF